MQKKCKIHTNCTSISLYTIITGNFWKSLTIENVFRASDNLLARNI